MGRRHRGAADCRWSRLRMIESKRSGLANPIGPEGDPIRPEGENFERKSKFFRSQSNNESDLEPVKTLTAFANTAGGTIHFEILEGCNLKDLDSARIDDLCRRYVAPPLPNIQSQSDGKKGILISIPKSPLRPHVFKTAGNFLFDGKQKNYFYPGQIVVRHSSKTEPADANDLQKIFEEKLIAKIKGIGDQLVLFAQKLKDSSEGLPVQLVDDNSAIPLGIPDLSPLYPYTYKQLEEKTRIKGKSLRKIFDKYRIKEKRQFSIKIEYGKTTIFKYSEHVLDFLRNLASEEAA